MARVREGMEEQALFQVGLEAEAGTLLPLCPRHTRRRQQRRTIGKRELSQQKSLNLLVVKVCSSSSSALAGRRRSRVGARAYGSTCVKLLCRWKKGEGRELAPPLEPGPSQGVVRPQQVAGFHHLCRLPSAISGTGLSFPSSQRSRGGGRLTVCTYSAKVVLSSFSFPHLTSAGACQPTDYTTHRKAPGTLVQRGFLPWRGSRRTRTIERTLASWPLLSTTTLSSLSSTTVTHDTSFSNISTHSSS